MTDMHRDDFGIADNVRIEAMPAETILKARLTVCRNATDAIDAKDLLEMLGLYA